ncbi:MAG: hypothetical protein EOO90_17450 [Pedobacter sp.]|nr:MAG: hypothetical protein EOO90_17450 [Pedobacter sp.]
MKKKLIVLIITWLVFVASDYFILPYFVQPLIWILFCLVLVVLLIIQIVKTIKERKNLKLIRVSTLSTIFILFFMTFYNFNEIPHLIMEKIDWHVSYQKRNQIVKEVINGKLKSNTKMHNGICKLSFEFPIVSNGGNDILIDKNKDDQTRAVHFWISRGFFDSPQIYFVYTHDAETKRHLQNMIESRPEYNWKIEENWYRITERL